MIQLTDHTIVTDAEEQTLEKIRELLVKRHILKMTVEEMRTTAGVKKVVVLAALKFSLSDLHAVPATLRNLASIYSRALGFSCHVTIFPPTTFS